MAVSGLLVCVLQESGSVLWTLAFALSVLQVRVPAVGNSNSIPESSPLGCILQHWREFCLPDLETSGAYTEEHHKRVDGRKRPVLSQAALLRAGRLLWIWEALSSQHSSWLPRLQHLLTTQKPLPHKDTAPSQGHSLELPQPGGNSSGNGAGTPQPPEQQ